MGELVVYIKKDLHTGHLREAAIDLFSQDLKIVEICDQQVQRVSPPLTELRTPSALKLALSVCSVPKKEQNKWEKAESWVTKMLVSAHIIDYPQRTEWKLSEFLDGISSLNSKDEALGFLNLKRHRLRYFLSTEGQERFDALRLGTHAFAENYTLKRALYHGVYLYRVG